MSPPLHCLTCRERIAVKRGCCIRCIMRHRGAVAKGKTTWAELEERSLILPAQATGAAWRRPW